MGRLRPALSLAALGILVPWTPRVRAGTDEEARTPEVAAVAPSEGIVVDDVALGELRANPMRFLGRRVRFVLQLDETAEAWNPYFSRFGPADWIAIQGWSDEAFTWEADVFESPAKRLFVRRSSRLVALVRRTPRYGRFRVTARVREVFADEPWLEVESLEPLREAVGEGTILHVGRALALIERGERELALSQLGRAKAAPLPPHARAEIERLEEECRRSGDELAALRDRTH